MVDFRKFDEWKAQHDREQAERPPRVVFTGSRDWTASGPVAATINALHAAGYRRGAHGAARGLDAIVDREARPLWGDEVKRYEVTKADWDRIGKSAGIRRNEDMLREEEPHLVVAFPTPKSVGTWHCAVAADCPVLVFLGGVKDAIAAQAREWGIDPNDRVLAVESYVGERVREQVTRSRCLLSWPRISMPNPARAWALLLREDREALDSRSCAGLDALLGPQQ